LPPLIFKRSVQPFVKSAGAQFWNQFFTQALRRHIFLLRNTPENITTTECTLNYLVGERAKAR